jgi:hypothetical protein
MALMNLSVSSFPFTLNGVAGIELFVSVTDANGVACTSLGTQNFHIAWLLDGVNRTGRSLPRAEWLVAVLTCSLPGQG